MSVSLPILTNLGSLGEHEKRQKLLLANVLAAGIIGFGLAIGIAIVSGGIMASYGPGFGSGRPTLVLQVFAAGIAAIVGVIGQFIISIGAMWWLIFLQAIWAAVNLSLTWVLRGKGAEGVALAYLLAYVVHLGATSGVTFWKLRVTTKELRPLDTVLESARA